MPSQPARSADEIRSAAVLLPKGTYFEDFHPGRVFEHHWGRTVTESDNSFFTTMTLHFNPTYFNDEYARSLGYRASPVNPYLVFNIVFGLTTEDLSELGGAFLGVDDMEFEQPVYPRDTLLARSTVVDRRESSSRKDQGIVTWHTEGFRADGERVIHFRRTNLVLRKPAQ
jgi:itaconyl-CoA hydratase